MVPQTFSLDSQQQVPASPVVLMRRNPNVFAVPGPSLGKDGWHPSALS